MATRDYTLGKGKVLFKPEGQDAYIDLGNAPAFNITLTVDKLEHFSSREGLSTKDLEVITKMGMGGSFTLDEPNAENLRMFVMSSVANTTPSTQAAAALAAIDDVQLPASSALGKWYTLGSSLSGVKTTGALAVGTNNIGTALVTDFTIGGAQTANASYDWAIRVTGANTIQTRRAGQAWSSNITIADTESDNILDGANPSGLTITPGTGCVAKLSVGDEFTFSVTYVLSQTTRVYNIDAGADTVTVKSDGGGTTYVEGIEGVGNYQVDRAAGLLYINLDQASPVAAITDGQLLEVEVKKLDGTKTTALGASTTTIRGDLYFVGNPPVGRVLDISGFCALTPNGDFALIGEDWMQMQFNVEFLTQTGVTGLIKVEDRGKI